MPYVACGYEKCNAACRSHYGLHHKVLTKKLDYAGYDA